MNGAVTADTLWRKIVCDIEAMIEQRELVIGDRLPTELELSRRYFVNRQTVRRAFKELQARGLVDATQGRGRFVRRPPATYTIRSGGSFSRDTRAAGHVPRAETLQIHVTKARDDVADALEVPERAPIAMLQRRNFVDDEPIGLGRHYVARVDPARFVAAYGETSSISQALAANGVASYERLRTLVRTRLPSPDEMELLNTPAHVPLFAITFVNIGPDGRPVEFGDTLLPSDRAEICVDASNTVRPTRPP